MATTLLGVMLGLVAPSAPARAGTPPCAGAGTVFSQAQIGQGVGGFGEGLDAGDRFGAGVASIGDLDGDGVPDLAVGAFADDDGGSNRGAVWILFLDADGAVKAKQKISSTQGGFGSGLDDNDFFGTAVGSLGDLDGDGVTDIAVGARHDDDGGIDSGAVWILFLNADGTVKAKQKISSTLGGFGSGLGTNDQFGVSVAALGDLDGDGVTDVAVGAYLDDDGGPDRGAVWILFLNASGTVKAKQKISSIQGGFGSGLGTDDEFGFSAGFLGDLDGNGVNDVAIGARNDDDGGTDRGAIWILFLNSNGTVMSKQKISSTQGGFGSGLDNLDLFGVSVAALDDVDGDGVVDLAVGAFDDDDGGINRGAVWVLLLNVDGVVKSKQKISQTAGGFAGVLLDNGGFGRACALLGDVDGSGRIAMVVSAHADAAPVNPGEIWTLELNTCASGPTITEHPVSVLLAFGGGLAQFSVAAEGSGPLAYQWRKDGSPLIDGGAFLGVDTPALTVTATTAEIGLYDCVVSSPVGASPSLPAVLGIRSSCAGDLNGDGLIDGADLGILLTAWGVCPP